MKEYSVLHLGMQLGCKALPNKGIITVLTAN